MVATVHMEAKVVQVGLVAALVDQAEAQVVQEVVPVVQVVAPAVLGVVQVAPEVVPAVQEGDQVALATMVRLHSRDLIMEGQTNTTRSPNMTTMKTTTSTARLPTAKKEAAVEMALPKRSNPLSLILSLISTTKTNRHQTPLVVDQTTMTMTVRPTDPPRTPRTTDPAALETTVPQVGPTATMDLRADQDPTVATTDLQAALEVDLAITTAPTNLALPEIMMTIVETAPTNQVRTGTTMTMMVVQVVLVQGPVLDPVQALVQVLVREEGLEGDPQVDRSEEGQVQVAQVAPVAQVVQVLHPDQAGVHQAGALQDASSTTGREEPTEMGHS